MKEPEMIHKTLFASALALSLLLAGAPADAHHSANAEFDVSKLFTLTGVLTKLENVNPHSWWYVNVKGADGTMTPWKLESLSPSGLIRQGVKVKQDIRVGETYSFRVYPAWKDPAIGYMKGIILNDKEFVLDEL
jgi:hypothetical protein